MIIIQAVNIFFQVVIYMILGRAIMSWFIKPGDRLFPFYRKLCQLTDPILAPFQRLTYRFTAGSGVDISALLALLALWLIQSLVVRLLITVLL